jgi:hypothetical protein
VITIIVYRKSNKRRPDFIRSFGNEGGILKSTHALKYAIFRVYGNRRPSFHHTRHSSGINVEGGPINKRISAEIWGLTSFKETGLVCVHAHDC